MIDTNWMLRLNEKTTRLYYDDLNVLLDHSNESVSISRSGAVTEIVDLSNERARLTNHYISLFIDMTDMIANGKTNLQIAEPLHRLLINAAFSKNWPSR